MYSVADRADLQSNDSDFGEALRQGLSLRNKAISPKFFYDAAGSALFEQICALPEYYPTRTEIAMLKRHAFEIADHLGRDADIIEFGAGSSIKIRCLLDALTTPKRFIPIDISGEHLHGAAASLRADYPWLSIAPVVADFTQPFDLPAGQHGRRIGFFPGSSIGNFQPAEALHFLQNAARLLHGGGLLIGVDLVKDPAILHAAYNDAAGVTAAFNRNLLVRANRELGANFNVAAFQHYAFYNPLQQRIEMHLISQTAQVVSIGKEQFSFAQGESIHTENSYKYTVAGFRNLAIEAGFQPHTVWQDQGFSLHWLRA